MAVQRLQDVAGFTENPVTEQAGVAPEPKEPVSPPTGSAPVSQSQTPETSVPGEQLQVPSDGPRSVTEAGSPGELIGDLGNSVSAVLEASLESTEPIDEPIDPMAGYQSSFRNTNLPPVDIDLSNPEDSTPVASLGGYESVFSPRASSTSWSPAQSSTTRTLSTATPPRATQVSAPSYIRYANNNATRNRAISEPLQQGMSFLKGMGITMEVFSGGQPSKEEGGGRVGSTRHDHGHAADVFFYKDGRKLNYNNRQDLPILQEIVRQARRSGITGIGAGPGYMQEGAFHIGFGTEAVWGAGGTRSNAPDWLVEAFYS